MPSYDQFHELCHGNCVLRYIGGVLELKNLDFRGLKDHLDVKKVNFRGLIAKIGHYWAILVSRTHL